MSDPQAKEPCIGCGLGLTVNDRVWPLWACSDACRSTARAAVQRDSSFAAVRTSEISEWEFQERVVKRQRWAADTSTDQRGYVTANQRFAWNEALRWNAEEMAAAQARIAELEALLWKWQKVCRRSLDPAAKGTGTVFSKPLLADIDAALSRLDTTTEEQPHLPSPSVDCPLCGGPCKEGMTT